VSLMIRPSTASLAFVCVVLFAAAACADGTNDTTDAGVAEPTPNAIDQPTEASATVACQPVGSATSDLSDWPIGGSEDPAIIPVIASSLLAAEPSRFMYSITDGDYRVLTSPEIPSSIDFYALERDPQSAAASVDAVYLDTLLGRGLYRASVDFECAGEWGAEVSAELEDGTTVSERLRFRVHPQGTTPAIGAAAPRSDSPTATTTAEMQLISTDPNPFPGAYERTVGEVVTGGQPSLVFFATPAFCQTGYCGPTVNLVKSVAIDYEDQIGFVNIEPYELHMTENGLQPLLEDGQLVPVQAVLDYGIPVEPYLFLVDAEGDVFAKFEGVVGADELRGAIEDALAEAA
jgi:hypothetical protein